MTSAVGLLLPCAAGGAWVAAAVVGSGVGPLAAAVTAAAAVCAAVGFGRSRRSTRALVLALLIGAWAGGLAAGARAAADHADPLHGGRLDDVRVRLTVLDDPVPLRDGSGRSASERLGDGGRCRVEARVERVFVRAQQWTVRSPIVVIGSAEWCQVPPGAQVDATVRLGPPPVADLGSGLATARGDPLVVAPPPRWAAWASGIRGDLRAAAAEVPWPAASLVPALVVGDESGLPDGAIDDLRGAGLGHLTAVSGANVASVLVGVLAIGAALGLHRRSLAVLAIATVAAFAVLARAEPSVLRAGAMAILAALASLRSGRVSGAAVLSASILVLVLLDPALALEPGFTLSVVATAGLLAAAGRIRPGTGRRRAVQAVLTVGVAALAAQAAVAPFVAAWSGRIDAGGLVANVVVAPLVPVITLLGLAAAVVAPAVPALAAVLVGVASGPASVLLAVAAAVSAQRWSGLPWPRGWAGGLVLAACLLVAGSVIVALRARHRWRAEVPPSGSSTRRLAAAGSALALVVAVVVVGPIDAERRWPPPGWRVVMCDAGQGDAVVLAGLADGSGAIVVDAGPDARLVDRCLRDLAVDHVALLVLTHFHADHAGGVAGVVRGRRVDEILVSPLAEPVDQARRVEQVAARASVPVSVAVTGAGARVAGWTLRVLGPGRPDPDAPSAPNDASIVLLADADGIEVLLLGDAEVAAQRRMLTRWPDAVRADVVKVAHHGSRVQDPQLLARTRAAVALVGVGCGNRYGHPAEQTLAAYRTQGAVIARTDRHGDVAVALTREGVRAIVRGPDPRSPSRTACR